MAVGKVPQTGAINAVTLLFREFTKAVASLERPIALAALDHAREKLGRAVTAGKVDAREMQRALDLIKESEAAIQNAPRAPE